MHPVGSYCTATYPPTCFGQPCYNPLGGALHMVDSLWPKHVG